METKHRSQLVLEATELVQALQRRQAPDVDSVLGKLTDTAVRSIPGAEYAGITIATGDGDVRTAAATGRYPVLLDEIQQRYHQGPCLSAAWEQRMIRIDDMAREQRWPRYCRDAAAHTPIRSAMSFQLFADPQSVGALNFYAEQPDAFDDEAVEIGRLLATHTALVWNLVRRDEQFRSALASRDIIGQAKGMIMERFGIDAVQAFELLKRLSQSSNTPVVAVARQLVETEHPSDDNPARQ
jgi:transcriptional regulator with GAF, ATPase, and Fis domain